MDASITVRQIITLYLRHTQAEGIHCPAVVEDRQYTYKLFIEQYGDMLADECKPYHLKDFIESHTGWRSIATRRKNSNAVRAAFSWAAREERIARNPFVNVHYAEAERRQEMPDELLGRMANLTNKRFEAVMRFLRLTGCRLGELCAATWQNIDLERGLWVIPKHKSVKYTRKPKIVALTPDAVALLREVRNVQPEGYTGAVFLNNWGFPWKRKSLSVYFVRLKKKHGVDDKISLHSIRHRFAGAAIAAGAPIKLIAEQLGHSSVTITERYYVDLSDQMDAIRDAAALAVPKKNV